MPQSSRADVKQQVGEFIVESILSSVASQKSPVKGESWPSLERGPYRDKKKSEAGNTEANMELTGDMLDALTFRNTKEGVEVGFFNKQAWKADGHNKFSGKQNHTPKRRFLPGEGQQFVNEITNEINKIIIDAQVGETKFSAEDLKQIETKDDLYDYLSDQLDMDSRTAIRLAVLRNESLVNKLDKYDLLDLL